MQNIEEYKKMYSFMYRELVRHRNYIEITLNKHDNEIKKLLKRKKNKVAFEEYEFYRANYSFYYQKICNIIGDVQGDSISYKSLIRQDYIKKFSLNIDKKPDEINRILNVFKDQRHWRSHFSIADGRAKTQDLKVIDEDEISIHTPKYMSLDIYIDLYKENIELISIINLLEEYILHDYYTFFGKNISVSEDSYFLEGLEALSVSNLSYQYSKTKKYSTAKRK